MENPFTEEQLTLFNSPLPLPLLSQRKGASGGMLKYIEGHDAIDQANRLLWQLGMSDTLMRPGNPH